MFGTRLKLLRERRGMGQRVLAEWLGTTVSAISMYEQGRREPDLTAVGRLAEFFNVSVDYLLGRVPYETPLPPDAFPASVMVQVPIYGEMSPGQPLLAEGNVLGWEMVPADAVHGGEFFFLTMHGDSMSGDGILPGSRLLVRRQPTVDNGEIAVVVVGEDEATVKRYHHLDTCILLAPANPAHPPQVHDLGTVQVIGKVVQSVVRYE